MRHSVVVVDCVLPQTKLLGAAVEPAVYDDAAYRGGEAFRPSHPGRVLPRRSGYGPYSSSAVEAARRRTQDLYNARRAQQGAPTPSTDDAFPPPPPSVVGRQLIWSRTSGRPQTGSYVINPRGFDEGGLVSPSGTDYQQQPGGETSMYFPAEEASPGNGHSMVVEATIENQQPNSPDTPGGTSTVLTCLFETCFHPSLIRKSQNICNCSVFETDCLLATVFHYREFH